MPIMIKASNLIQTQIIVDLSYKHDGGGIKTNTQTKTQNKKTLQVYAIKCIDRKTKVRRVQSESVLD